MSDIDPRKLMDRLLEIREERSDRLAEAIFEAYRLLRIGDFVWGLVPASSRLGEYKFTPDLKRKKPLEIANVFVHQYVSSFERLEDGEVWGVYAYDGSKDRTLVLSPDDANWDLFCEESDKRRGCPNHITEPAKYIEWLKNAIDSLSSDLGNKENQRFLRAIDQVLESGNDSERETVRSFVEVESCLRNQVKKLSEDGTYEKEEDRRLLSERERLRTNILLSGGNDEKALADFDKRKQLAYELKRDVHEVRNLEEYEERCESERRKILGAIKNRMNNSLALIKKSGAKPEGILKSLHQVCGRIGELEEKLNGFGQTDSMLACMFNAGRVFERLDTWESRKPAKDLIGNSSKARGSHKDKRELLKIKIRSYLERRVRLPVARKLAQEMGWQVDKNNEWVLFDDGAKNLSYETFKGWKKTLKAEIEGKKRR